MTSNEKRANFFIDLYQHLAYTSGLDNNKSSTQKHTQLDKRRNSLLEKVCTFKSKRYSIAWITTNKTQGISQFALL